MQIAASGPDNQEPLKLSIKYISYKPANLRNAKNASGIDMTESGVSVNKTGKHMDESVEGFGALDAVATKSLNVFVGGLRDVRGSENTFKITDTDIVAVKSLDISVEGLGGDFKIAKTDTVAAKSSDILVGGLGGIGSLEDITKSAIIIIKRWETPTISGTRVPIISNLNNPALAFPPFTSS